MNSRLMEVDLFVNGQAKAGDAESEPKPADQVEWAGIKSAWADCLECRCVM